MITYAAVKLLRQAESLSLSWVPSDEQSVAVCWKMKFQRNKWKVDAMYSKRGMWNGEKKEERKKEKENQI